MLLFGGQSEVHAAFDFTSPPNNRYFAVSEVLCQSQQHGACGLTEKITVNCQLPGARGAGGEQRWILDQRVMLTLAYHENLVSLESGTPLVETSLYSFSILKAAENKVLCTEQWSKAESRPPPLTCVSEIQAPMPCPGHSVSP